MCAKRKISLTNQNLTQIQACRHSTYSLFPTKMFCFTNSLIKIDDYSLIFFTYVDLDILDVLNVTALEDIR